MRRKFAPVLVATLMSSLSPHVASSAADFSAAQSPTQQCACASTDGSDCNGLSTHADGRDGVDNSGTRSGIGGKGGTITGANACGGVASTNGGNGGNHNRGSASGTGGAGGQIKF